MKPIAVNLTRKPPTTIAIAIFMVEGRTNEANERASEKSITPMTIPTARPSTIGDMPIILPFPNESVTETRFARVALSRQKVSVVSSGR